MERPYIPNTCRPYVEWLEGRVRDLEIALDATAGSAGPELSAPNENRVGPSSRGSTTSQQAAREVYPKSGSQRHRVFTALALAPEGLTRDELAANLHLPDSSVDARIWELRTKSGWVRNNGNVRCTRSGKAADVLVLSQRGWEIYHHHELGGPPPVPTGPPPSPPSPQAQPLFQAEEGPGSASMFDPWEGR